MSQKRGNDDLKRFMDAAGGEVRRRINTEEAGRKYTDTLNRLRMLEELIKEQTPHEDPGSAAGPSR